jgi:hypothetical protein
MRLLSWKGIKNGRSEKNYFKKDGTFADATINRVNESLQESQI